MKLGKRKLLVLASTYPRWKDDVEPGFVHELSRRLVDDFDVSVLCPHTYGAKVFEKMDDVDVYRYRYAPEMFETLVSNGGIIGNLRKSAWKWFLVPGFLLSQFLQTVWLIRCLKPDVIHAHWLFPQGAVASLASLLCRRAVIVMTSHGSDLYMLRKRPLRPIRRLISKHSQWLAVVGAGMRQTAIQLFPGTDVRVMPMGIDFQNQFVVGASVPRVPGRILYVGRLVREKGLSHLLAAFSLVKSLRPDAQLQVLGQGPDEDYFRSIVLNYGLKECVSFEGARPNNELWPFYARCDLFVAPFSKKSDGRQEGLGLVLLEAIGTGCAVLTGEIDISRELGIAMTDIHHPEIFAQEIVRMLSEPEIIRSVHSDSLRARVVAQYDWSVVSGAYRESLLSAAKSNEK